MARRRNFPSGFPTPQDWFENELQSLFRNTMSDGSRSGRRRGATSPRTRRGGWPAVNIYDNGDAYRVRAEMPGVDTENLEISAKANKMVIRGERIVETDREGANYHRRERHGGTFRRMVNLPESIDVDNVEASFENGVLEIHAPRREETAPRRIDITG